MDKHSILDETIDDVDLSTQLLPEGEYNVKLTAVNDRISKRGLSYLELILRVIDGPIPGEIDINRIAPVRQNIFLPDPNDDHDRIIRSVRRIKAVAASFETSIGLTPRELYEDGGTFLKILAEQGAECTVRLIVEQPDNPEYSERNVVRRWIAA